ncbi:hypothetical protein [Streptomyces sp. DW26H14]|uniref:hypothetical protein n=1 Tax=Streptomyces sp. DW26H14 TaxID=3435395 RepID=UPI00403D960A
MPDTMSAAAAWLAAADPDKEHARRWLRSAAIILLPLGVRWSAIKVEHRTGLEAAAVVSGPAIHDPAGGCVYFLVPTNSEWQDDDRGELLGVACWLAVPTPGRLEPPGPYWISPPDGAGELVDTEALRAVLCARRDHGETPS